MNDRIEVHEASIDELQRALEEGRATSLELVEAYLARIEAYDASGPALNAITLVHPEAREQARAFDRERAERGPRGPLHGVPILVKDNHDVAGLPTRAGSWALEGLVAEKDARVVAGLRSAGAVILGKTNLHELAAGITSVGSAHGRTRNPYDPRRNPGGSSGGSGAGVAASFAAAGLGSDTCGSIRIPAAHNALFGLRPTQGLTSLEGVVPLALTQDTVGPLARTARDLALVLDAMVDEPKFASALGEGALAGRRIGGFETLFGSEPEDREVTDRVRAALEQMAKAGAEIVSVALPELPTLLDTGFTVILGDLPGDLGAYLAGNPTAPVQGLAALLATGRVHPEVAPVLSAAAAADVKRSEAYSTAIANRQRLERSIVDLLDRERLDALAYPTILRVAAPLGEEQLGSNAHASANSGLPAITMPAGASEGGMPIGLELMGRPGSDVDLVALAHAWELAEAPRLSPTLTPPL